MNFQRLPAANDAHRTAIISSMVCGVGILMGTLLPTAVEAAFYKCVDASGGVTYSSSECPTNEQVAKVIQAGGSRAALDCRIGRNFTRQVAPMVASGASADSAFNRYGGINALSPTTIGLINYLYSFKNNRDMSAARMSSLAISRCENGSFGPTDCAQFPMGFIHDLGGCEGALVLGGTRPDLTSNSPRQREASRANAWHPNAQQPNARQSGSLQPGAPSAAKPVDARLAQQRQLKRVEQCRVKLKDKIDKVNRDMRAASSIDRQEKLRAERRSLGRRLNQCY